jgi:hypothetical protein
MAKHVILEGYTFTPSTKTIVVTGKNIRREQLLLITNTSTGTVLYNFSDPALGASSYTNAVDATTGTETTTIVLAYNTSAMSATDKVSILVEETYQEMLPSEVMRDPVDKFRVSTPQSLIDTDFEYGQQPTKWESINLLNNRAASFYDPTITSVISAMTASSTTVSVTVTAYTASSGIQTAAIVSTITGIGSTAGLYPGALLIKQSGTGTFGAGAVATVLSIDSATQITVQTSAAMTTGALVFTLAMPSVGQPIFVQGTLDVANADGWWLCTSSNTSTGVFQYATIVAPAAALYDANKTYVYYGNFYTGAAIPCGTTAIVTDGTRATVTTTYAHGLRIGDSVFIVGTSTNTALNGNYVVERTLTTNTFTFLTAVAAATHTTTNSAGTIFPRPLGYVQHRPFDGGVQFSNVSPFHGYQVIRQTRRQFRYQSGKGIQFSTGSILKPAVFLESITSSGTVATITTKYTHGLLPGSYIKVSGVTAGTSTTLLDGYYNGTFLVTSVTPLTISYSMSGAPTNATATGFPLTANPASWYGSTNRVGMFDSQNGFFFEFDGQNIYCVKRSSTTQISGNIAINSGSNAVTGTSTKFSSQLKPGDYIVIRGMSYVVQSITSDTTMTVYPEYRGGTNVTNTVVSKTIDTRYVQSSWNIDKMDGTGASLMNLDLTKMQMFYCDFTWYGAGAIRFGFKNNRGEVVYCHRIPNNNVNTEAYMRSGNMVGRYETNTLAPYTYLTSTLPSAQTSLMSVNDVSAFPNSGTIVITQPGDTGNVIEYISYTSKTSSNVANTLVGLTRNVQNITITGAGTAAGGNASATSFTFSATAPTKVELYGPSQASSISHWGSSVIMDGRFDDDKSLVFVGGMNRTQTIANIGQDVVVPLVSIRIAPSVDNGLTGPLGTRDIINRMQLVMRSLSTFTTGTGVTFLMTLRLNGRVSAGQFTSVGGSSLSQIAVHGSGTTITGGETIYGFYATTGINTEDLNQVRDLGTSILGGGTNNLCPTTSTNLYPDGPDIITICATNVTGITTNSILARISWTEAQA